MTRPSQSSSCRGWYAYAVIQSCAYLCLTGCGGALSGLDPLRVALKNGSRETYAALLKDGADPNTVAGDGLSVMHLSALEADSYWLRTALENGGDPNLKNPGASTNKRGTPMYYAITADRLDNVKVLVEFGADINAVDEFGQTPLADAFAHGGYDIVYYLLESGADYQLAPTGEYNSFLGFVKNAKASVIKDEMTREKLERVLQWLREKGVQLNE